jgi:hypothetical protein
MGDMAVTNDNIKNIIGHKPESVGEFPARNRQALA